MTSPKGRLGELMVASGVLDAVGLAQALAEQRRSGGKLGEVLVRLALVSEGQLTAFLAQQFQLSPVELDAGLSLPPAVLARVPAALAHALCALPLAYREEERCLVIAVAEPLRGERLERLRSHAQCWLLPRLAPERALRGALIRAYGPAPEEAQVVEVLPDRASRERDPARVLPTHPEVRALVALLCSKGLLTASEVERLFASLERADALAPDGSDPARDVSTSTSRTQPRSTAQETTT